MYINGAALARALWLVPILAAVFLAAVVAHLLWVVRLARSPTLRTHAGPIRVLLVALALATPVVSFYAVEIIGWWRHRDREATRRAAHLVAVAAVLTLTDAADTFIKLVRLLLVVQVPLAMAVRVFATRNGLVWDGAILSAASAAMLLVAV